MKIIQFEFGLKRRLWYLRGYILKIYLLSHGCKVGKNLKCKQFPVFRSVPYKNIIFGNNVTIGYRVTFEPIAVGKIILKDYVQLTQDILISSMSEVVLEEYVAVAEFVSIRDSDHKIQKGVIPHFQESVSEPILIKRGSGLGRGSAVFRGVTIENDVIIGANCILTRNFRSIPNGIYFGNLPKLIGKRF